MKQIVIIGNTVEGIKAAQEARDRDKEARIVILSEESVPAYEKPLLLKLLEGKMKEREILYRGPDFYKNFNIDLVIGAEVEHISPGRKRIVLKDRDREPIPYDEIILAAGSRFIKPALKGIQKEGVVTPNTLQDFKFLIDNLPIAHTVCIVGPGPTAEDLARIIAAKKIEVKFFGFLSVPIEGVEAIADNPILEILGEAEVKAVRLSSQKVLGASLVIFAGDTAQDDYVKNTTEV